MRHFTRLRDMTKLGGFRSLVSLTIGALARLKGQNSRERPFWEVEKSPRKGQKGFENQADACYLGLLGILDPLFLFFGVAVFDHIRG